MSYEKHTWETGEVITAEKLNHIEGGVAKNPYDNPFVITLSPNAQNQLVADKTWQEITEAYDSRECVVLVNAFESIMSPSSFTVEQGRLESIICHNIYVADVRDEASTLYCNVSTYVLTENEITYDSKYINVTYS